MQPSNLSQVETKCLWIIVIIVLLIGVLQPFNTIHVISSMVTYHRHTIPRLVQLWFTGTK